MDNLGFSVDYVHLQSGFVKLNIFLKKLHKSKYTEWSKEALLQYKDDLNQIRREEIQFWTTFTPVKPSPGWKQWKHTSLLKGFLVNLCDASLPLLTTPPTPRQITDLLAVTINYFVSSRVLHKGSRKAQASFWCGFFHSVQAFWASTTLYHVSAVCSFYYR